jgi:hypothetical protein
MSKFASIVDRVVTFPSNVPIDANDGLQLRENATIVEKKVDHFANQCLDLRQLSSPTQGNQNMA